MPGMVRRVLASRILAGAVRILAAVWIVLAAATVTTSAGASTRGASLARGEVDDCFTAQDYYSCDAAPAGPDDSSPAGQVVWFVLAPIGLAAYFAAHRR